MRERAFFLGQNKQSSYFEGWYFKCISKDRRHALAFIPGMAVAPDGRKHAFIQLIHAETGRTYYFSFPYEKFAAAKNRFDVNIAGNRFGPNGLQVELDQAGIGKVLGSLTFTDCREYPISPLHPGIMGPFSFVPNMECNHVIIHLAHRITGRVVIDGNELDFDGGAGYIEKDYGRSFPKTYVWLQASHFDSGEASFVFSRARIPFMGSSFPGFFAYFTDFAGISARFATYNGSKLIEWEVDKASGLCRGRLSNKAFTLVFQADMAEGGTLRAPVDGLMDREIIESIRAQVKVELFDRKGRLLYQGTSSEVGMEISM